MYTNFFGINDKPFSITPDPRYLFLSARHGEALAHLVYGVTESGGFIQLTGEVGTGKTTLCRTLLLNRMPKNADVAVVLNPQLSALEFLEAICEEVHIPIPEPRGSIKALIDTLNRHLLDAHAQGRRTILVVDEAQNLAPDVLEQVRLLTNLETSKQKLLQIILIGQPELRELLARNDLRQLAQRITGRYHLEPLTREETDQYIEHRLKVAGALGEVFDMGAKREVFRLSQGVPRLVNVICDRAMLGAYSQGRRRVTRKLVRRAAAEVTGEDGLRRSWARPAALAAATIVVLSAAGAWWILQAEQPTGGAAAVAAPETVEPPASAAPAAETETAVPEPASVDESLDQQLLLASGLTTENAALTTLFALWGLDFDGNAGGCEQAESRGFSCIRQRGSWTSLRQLDHPAMLTLVDSGGDAHRVILTATDGASAALSIAGVDVVHPVAALLDVWFGEYELLWRTPDGAGISLGPGSRGPAVTWLRQSLAAIDASYAAEPLESDVYDTGLEQRVRKFQRDQRLEVDGLAGQLTQIKITRLLAPDATPRLTLAQLAQE
jgi:general secretion pathway protein A